MSAGMKVRKGGRKTKLRKESLAMSPLPYKSWLRCPAEGMMSLAFDWRACKPSSSSAVGAAVVHAP